MIQILKRAMLIAAATLTVGHALQRTGRRTGNADLGFGRW